jgi:hypothetical protein
MTVLHSYVLRNCANLKTVIFGERIKTIYPHTFTNSGMEQIILPDSVETVDFSAFYTCLNLTDLTFGKNITTIASQACYRCEKLENIYYNGTKSEWLEVDKYSSTDGMEWNYNVPATVVHCIDGDVTI